MFTNWVTTIHIISTLQVGKLRHGSFERLAHNHVEELSQAFSGSNLAPEPIWTHSWSYIPYSSLFITHLCWELQQILALLICYFSPFIRLQWKYFPTKSHWIDIYPLVTPYLLQCRIYCRTKVSILTFHRKPLWSCSCFLPQWVFKICIILWMCSSLPSQLAMTSSSFLSR